MVGPVASEGGVGRDAEDSESDSPEFMASVCELLLANQHPALSLSFFICQMGTVLMPAFSSAEPCGKLQERMCTGYNVS